MTIEQLLQPECGMGYKFVLTARRPRFLCPDLRSSGDADAPVLFGGGSDTLLCGECRFALAIAVDFRDVAYDLEVRCPQCGCENGVC